ncbi:MAG TPA: elongation factor G [Anaerolineae bacterium]|nr:elongation factor G [Anaerolineae bacterium]
MKDYSTDALRNVVLLGHGSAGKTMLGEAMLFSAGAISRLGRVEDGTTVADFDEEEIRRRISLSTALLPVEWKEHKLNVLDTPGFPDFVGEVKGAVRVAECALILVDSVAGVEVGTELAWSYCDERDLPRMVVVGKMDRDNADFEKALESLTGSFKANFVPLFLPIGAQANLKGILDVTRMKARMGAKGELADIPADMAGAAEDARGKVVEAAAEGDDELIMKFLDGQELTDEEVTRGLRAALRNRTLVPVLCAASTTGVGVSGVLDALVEFAPSPLDVPPQAATRVASDAEETLEATDAGALAALVFKSTADPFVGKLTYFRVYRGAVTSDSRVYNSTHSAEERIGQIYVMRGKEQSPVPRVGAGDIGLVAKLGVTMTGDTLCVKENAIRIAPPAYPDPLITIAVEPKTQADSAKMGPTLTKLSEEDPTLRWRQEPSIKQTLLEGMGDNHLDVAIRRAHTKFGVELVTHPPKVPYRETITKTAETTYRHKKQTGGAGQFAEVAMRVEPQEPGKGYEFSWKVFGGAISTSFQSSIEKGIKAVMESGALAGYPIVDVKCAVVDGKEHPVDSKPIAFETAGREAFKQAVLGANPVLLEPIVTLRVVVPDSYTGDVIGDLNTKRARVQGMDQEGGKAIVTASVPLAEVQRYATDLRSLTQGRGVFSMKFDRYEQVPAHIAQGLIERARKERAGEKAEE